MLKYNDFINIDYLYLENKITFNKWKNVMDSFMPVYESNEWLSKMIEWIKSKMITSIKSWIEKSKNAGVQILSKIFESFKWFCDKIEKFKEKHNLLYFTMMGLLISGAIVSFLIMTTQSAKAGDLNSEQIGQNYDLLIGYIKEKMTDSGTLSDTQLDFVNHSIAFLKDQKDGILGNEGIDWNNENQESIKKFIDEMQKSMNNSLDELLKSNKNTIWTKLIIIFTNSGKEVIGFAHDSVTSVCQLKYK